MRRIQFLLLFLSLYSLGFAEEDEFKKIDQIAGKAYVELYRSAQKFELKSRNAKLQEIKNRFDSIEQERILLKSKFNGEKLTKFQNIIREYEKILSKADAENWAFAAYNLGLAQFEASSLEKIESNGDSDFNRLKKAAVILNDPRVKDRKFPLFSEAQFLLFQIYEFLNDSTSSRKTLEFMNFHPTESIYSSYGFEKYGDLHFKDEKDELAVSAYKSALQGFYSHGLFADIFKLKYKLAWASFRSNNSSLIEEHCVDFLSDPKLKAEAGYQELVDEISHIYSSYLFFDNDRTQLKDKLNEHKNAGFYASLVRNVVYFQLQSGQLSEADFFVRSIIDRIIALKEYPDILLLMIGAYKDNLHQGIFYSDRLAEIGSKNSIWSMLYGSEENLTSLKIPMRYAHIVSASYYYKKAAATRSLNFYSRSREYFVALSDLDSASNFASRWAIYIGHTYLNSHEFRDAIVSYESTLKILNLSEEDIVDIKYRIILALQGAIYAEYGNQDKSDISIKNLNKDLNILEKYTVEISTQFPDNSLSHEALATSSAVLRDFERFEVAHEFWKKLLLQTKSLTLRERAIRGLIYNAISNLSPKSSLEQTKLILRSENSNKISSELYDEIVKIAETSAINEVARLKQIGEFKNAANEFIALIEEFPEVFNNEYFYREAAYCFAMVEEWGEIKKVAQEFLRQFQDSKFRADILYIVGRAYQETFDYSRASDSYLELASMHPNHRKSEQSLKFAIAYYQKSGSSSEAAAAIKIMEKFARSGTEKFQTSLDAIHILVSNSRYDEALKIVEELLNRDLTRSQKVQAKFIEIKLLYLGDKKNEIEILTRRFQRDFAALGPKLSANEYETTKVDLELLLIDGDLTKFKELVVSNNIDGISTLEERVRIYRKVNSRLSPLLSLKHHSAHRQIHVILNFLLERLIFDHDQLLLLANSELVFSEKAFLDSQLLKLRAEHLAQQGALRLSKTTAHETDNLRSYISNTFKVNSEY